MNWYFRRAAHFWNNNLSTDHKGSFNKELIKSTRRLTNMKVCCIFYIHFIFSCTNILISAFQSVVPWIPVNQHNVHGTLTNCHYICYNVFSYLDYLITFIQAFYFLNNGIYSSLSCLTWGESVSFPVILRGPPKRESLRSPFLNYTRWT